MLSGQDIFRLKKKNQYCKDVWKTFILIGKDQRIVKIYTVLFKGKKGNKSIVLVWAPFVNKNFINKIFYFVNKKIYALKILDE